MNKNISAHYVCAWAYSWASVFSCVRFINTIPETVQYNIIEFHTIALLAISEDEPFAKCQPTGFLACKHSTMMQQHLPWLSEIVTAGTGLTFLRNAVVLWTLSVEVVDSDLVVAVVVRRRNGEGFVLGGLCERNSLVVNRKNQIWSVYVLFALYLMAKIVLLQERQRQLKRKKIDSIVQR